MSAAVTLVRFRRTAAGATGYATGVLVGDLSMHHLVFIVPTSSTTALGLLVAPFWNLVLLGPIGAVVGWAVARLVGRCQGGMA